MQVSDRPGAGEELPAITARQGTVVELAGHSVAIERIEDEDDPPSVRITVMPEPGREWAATGVFTRGQWLPLRDRCYAVASVAPSIRGERGSLERGSVLLKGPRQREDCGFGEAAVPVFAGDAGTRIGSIRVAAPELPADGADAVIVATWPSLYTLASAPADEVLRRRIEPGEGIDIDGRRYRLASVRPADEALPAYLTLVPL